jgi:hypothetical protein
MVGIRMTALLFVAGVCGRSACGRAFVLASPAGPPPAGASYCSETCRKAVNRKNHRMRQRPSCAGCSVTTEVRVPICRDCRRLLAVVCAGKQRIGLERAKKTARRHGMDVYLCPVCEEPHVGHSGPATRRNGRMVQTIVGRLRAAGQGWVLCDLAFEWHPRRVARAEVREAVLS